MGKFVILGVFVADTAYRAERMLRMEAALHGLQIARAGVKMPIITMGEQGAFLDGQALIPAGQCRTRG